jgi:hypothetical protein
MPNLRALAGDWEAACIEGFGNARPILAKRYPLSHGSAEAMRAGRFADTHPSRQNGIISTHGLCLRGCFSDA